LSGRITDCEQPPVPVTAYAGEMLLREIPAADNIHVIVFIMLQSPFSSSSFLFDSELFLYSSIRFFLNFVQEFPLPILL
jgi:hypothetical protein